MNTRIFWRGAVALIAVMAVAMPGGIVNADNKPLFSLQGKPQSQQPTPDIRNLQAVKPDLVVVSVTPGPAPNRPVLVRVQNAGNAPSAATNVKISCELRSVPNHSSNCQMGSVTGHVSPLGVGAQETITVATGSLGKAGSPLVGARVTACVDSGNVVHESNESNNCGNGNW